MNNMSDILDFNFAQDIQEEWESYMEDGYTINEATTSIIEQYGDILEEEENMLLYITLGLIQVELEQMDARVKQEVSELLGTKGLDAYLENTKECKRMIQLLKKRCR